MIYIFDIMLNFNKEFYKFYEWESNDNIVNYKKIPLFKISSKFMEEIYLNNIKIEKEFLKILEGKNNHNNLSVLFTDSKEVIGLLFDKEGNILKRSSVIIDDELEILTLSNNLKPLVLKYDILYKIQINNSSREEEKLKKILINRINSIKEEGLIKYINYDSLNIKSESKKYLLNYIKNGNYWDNKKLLNSIFEVLSIN